MFTFQNGVTFFFIHKDVNNDNDKELFFGPLTGNEVFVEFDDSWTMANIMVAIGSFPSITQAKKNGVVSEIDVGFSTFTKGKGKKFKDVTILNKWN